MGDSLGCLRGIAGPSPSASEALDEAAKGGRNNTERMRNGECQRFFAVLDGIPPTLRQTFPRTSWEPQGSLAVAPLIRNQRGYGETPVGLRRLDGGISVRTGRAGHSAGNSEEPR